MLLIEAFVRKPSQQISGYFSVFAQVIALALLWRQIFIFKAIEPVALFRHTIQIDGFGLFVNALILIAGILASIASIDYLRRQGVSHGEYHAFQLFAVLGMMLMVSSMELVTLFISLELMSLSIYIMCGYRRDNARGIESAIKYFLLGGFAAAILLFGIAHLFGQSGSTYLLDIARAMRTGLSVSGSTIGNPALMKLGMAMFAAGILFKVAAVPMHFWLPDAYDGAPAPVTGFMAAAVKAAAFAVLVKFLYFTSTGNPAETNPRITGLHPPFDQAILFFACVTMLIPNLIALCQTSVKRILAYSSIAHAGYMLVGVRCMANYRGVGGDDATAALLYYLMAYGLMTLGAFIIVGRLSGPNEERGQLDDLNGIGYRQPFLSLVMAICVLSMAGSPPLAGFWGKYLVFKTAVDNGYIGFAVFAIISSVIAVFYYLRILVHMYMRPAEADFAQEAGEEEAAGVLRGWDFKVSLGAIAFALIWLGMGPFTVLKIVPGSETLWNWSKVAAEALSNQHEFMSKMLF